MPDKIELPNRKLEEKYSKDLVEEAYKKLIERNTEKVNRNAINIEKIAIVETVTVTSKVKDIFRELVKKPRFVFNKLFALNEKPKAEIVTAFSSVLELSRRNKINAEQEETFGDIIISKRKRENIDETSSPE